MAILVFSPGFYCLSWALLLGPSLLYFTQKQGSYNFLWIKITWRIGLASGGRTILIDPAQINQENLPAWPILLRHIRQAGKQSKPLKKATILLHYFIGVFIHLIFCLFVNFNLNLFYLHLFVCLVALMVLSILSFLFSFFILLLCSKTLSFNFFQFQFFLHVCLRNFM